MTTKTVKKLQPVTDFRICNAIRAIGIREIARRVGVSPAMVCLFASGKNALNGEDADKIIAIAKRSSSYA